MSQKMQLNKEQEDNYVSHFPYPTDIRTSNALWSTAVNILK